MNLAMTAVAGLVCFGLSTPGHALETVRRTVPAANDGGTNVSIGYENHTGLSGMQSFKTFTHFWVLDSSPWSTRFVATQFDIGGDAMYIGINPPDSKLPYRGQAHFSYFGSRGGKLLSNNCAKGADGGAGISCASDDVRAKQGYTYELEARVSQTTSDGVIVEGYATETNGSTHEVEGSYLIGRFELKIPGGKFARPVTWVEGGADRCSEVKRTQIMFGPIFVNSKYDIANTARIDSIPRAKCGATVWPAMPDARYVFVEYGS